MAMVDRDDMPPRREREPLPSREQIEAISDIPALEQMQTDIDARINHIEVDLEYEVGDDDWDQRARGALAAHRICLGHVGRHLKHLRARVKPDKNAPAFITAKADKALANAERHKAMAASAQAEKANKETALRQARLNLIDRTTYQGCFIRAAQRLLDADTLERVTAAAQKLHLGSIKQETHIPPSADQSSPPETAQTEKDG